MIRHTPLSHALLAAALTTSGCALAQERADEEPTQKDLAQTRLERAGDDAEDALRAAARRVDAKLDELDARSLALGEKLSVATRATLADIADERAALEDDLQAALARVTEDAEELEGDVYAQLADTLDRLERDLEALDEDLDAEERAQAQEQSQERGAREDVSYSPPANLRTQHVLVPDVYVRHATVDFEEGSTRISIAQEVTLAQVSDWMLQNPERTLIVEGYADSERGPLADFELSMERADAVITRMVARGVDRDRLVLRTLGELAVDADADGRLDEDVVAFSIDSAPLFPTSTLVLAR